MKRILEAIILGTFVAAWLAIMVVVLAAYLSSPTIP